MSFTAPATAQFLSPERGSPLIRNFFPEEYHSDITCTSLLQSQSGLVYVGNERGVLEYDGAEWRLIQVPVGQDVRALAQADDGTLYAGGLKNIGYLEADERGQLQFHSLPTNCRKSNGISAFSGKGSLWEIPYTCAESSYWYNSPGAAC